MKRYKSYKVQKEGETVLAGHDSAVCTAELRVALTACIRFALYLVNILVWMGEKLIKPHP